MDDSHIANHGTDDNGYEEGGGSSDEDEQETGDLGGLPVPAETGSPSGEDKELKSRLLNKYSGYLSSLWRELSRKKKKGKLPRDARQKLLHWWQLHYRWPYPSVRACVNSMHVDRSVSLDHVHIVAGVHCSMHDNMHVRSCNATVDN